MGNTLITISRQHGSGGTKVAQILAEKLGIWYYNREILYIAADKIGYDSLDEKSMDEINYKKASYDRSMLCFQARCYDTFIQYQIINN